MKYAEGLPAPTGEELARPMRAALLALIGKEPMRPFTIETFSARRKIIIAQEIVEEARAKDPIFSHMPSFATFPAVAIYEIPIDNTTLLFLGGKNKTHVSSVIDLDGNQESARSIYYIDGRDYGVRYDEVSTVNRAGQCKVETQGVEFQVADQIKIHTMIWLAQRVQAGKR